MLPLSHGNANTAQREVLSKNFALPLSAWDNIPPQQLFIFPGTKAPTAIAEQNVTGSAGIVPLNDSYTYHLSKAPPTHETAGGTVKIIDPTTFPIASGFSAAIVTVKPGAMREIHWHTTSDEWNFFLAGKARISIYAAVGNARTFDYNAGDCGYVCYLIIFTLCVPFSSTLLMNISVAQIPKSMTHYVENIGTEDVVFIEVLQADHFSGMSPYV